MPLNNGNPDHRAPFQGRIGILVVDLGFAGRGIDRIPQPDHDAADSGAAFADTHPGVARLRQPDAGGLTAGLGLRPGRGKQRRQHCDDETESAGHEKSPRKAGLLSKKSNLRNAV
jgi:hypothetical protein